MSWHSVDLYNFVESVTLTIRSVLPKKFISPDGPLLANRWDAGGSPESAHLEVSVWRFLRRFANGFCGESLVTLVGFLLAAGSVGIVAGTSGRLMLVLVGIAVSLFGILGSDQSGVSEERRLEALTDWRRERHDHEKTVAPDCGGLVPGARRVRARRRRPPHRHSLRLRRRPPRPQRRRQRRSPMPISRASRRRSLKTARQGRSGRHDHGHGRRHSRQRREEGPDTRRRRQRRGPEPDRVQLRLDARHRLPRHVHAGRLCHRRNGPGPGEERQPHHDDELHGVRRRHARLLAHRLRHTGRRRGSGLQSGRHGAAQFRVRGAPVRQGLGPVRPERHHAGRRHL